MPLLTIQPDGRSAELIIDTGLRLRSGTPWRAYAKVPCHDPLHAELLAQRLGDAVENARREAYQQGYADASRDEAPRARFPRTL